MKKLTTLFAFLLFAMMAFSQMPVTVSGTITDIDGNPVPDITVHLFVDSTASGFVYFNDVITSADGTYSDTFDVPDTDTQGGISAWIYNCDQSILSQMGYWSPGGGPVIDFLYCNVCSASISEVANNSLQVTATGEAPFAYVWSEGSTTATISPSASDTYCVTATDANGCISSACFDYYVMVDTTCYVVINGVTPGELTAFPGGVAPFSYFWETGETTQTISIPGAGEYCLSVIDAVGCVASDCIVIAGGCDLDVAISEYDNTLSANTQASVSYAWSTGEATQSITVSTVGEYCVTITDAEDCTADACFYYDPVFSDSCYVSLQEVQNGGWLYADAFGNAPFAYLWSTGETTASIEMTEEIEYCVTITDATGCMHFSCFDNSPEPFLVYGYVYPYDSLTTDYIDGMAELYSIDGDVVTYVTSTPIDSNHYDFGEVTHGDYLTKAIVDGYLPTYHFNAEFWDEADIVAADAPLWWGYNISLLPLDDEFVNDGPALISGSVNGGVLAEIILYGSNGAIMYLFPDENGTYSFDGLPYGTYTVTIEIPGYGQVSYTITLSADNEAAENIDFNVDVNQNTITTGNREVLLANNTLSIYPNPAKSELTVSFDLNIKGNAHIQIINSIGQEVFSDTFEQNKMLNVSTLDTGIYLIKVTTSEGIAVKQFVKA